VALLWVAVAAVLALTAARRMRSADAIWAAAQANATLLALAPTRPLLVRPDGRIEIDAQLQRELGLAVQPQTLPELGGGGSGLVLHLRRR
jgi:hypothetical protein